MLSAIAPRKDSAQSSKEILKQQARDHTPHTTSPLANSSNPDIVTNDDRAKSPDLMRVLSPMRQRRTPKLVNAPEVRWRLPPGLQHMPSVDSILSSDTSASEASTVRQVPIAPQNVALPVSCASSVVTTTPQTDIEAPLPPSPSQHDIRIKSPPQQVNTRFNETRTRERIIPALGAHQPHFLSPVTEATSAPSIRSSILDLNVQDIGTAERRPLSDVRRQNVHVIGVSEGSLVGQQSRQGNNAEERYSASIRTAEEGGEFIVSGQNGGKRKQGIRGVVGKLRKSVKGAVGRVAECLARKYVTRVLARLL